MGVPSAGGVGKTLNWKWQCLTRPWAHKVWLTEYDCSSILEAYPISLDLHQVLAEMVEEAGYLCQLFGAW